VRPLILAVDGDAATRPLVRSELECRYGASYQVVVCATAEEADRALADAAAGAGGAGADVALVLADRCSGGASYLASLRGRLPHTRRGLLLAWGERLAFREELARALAALEADYYVAKPLSSPDEQFHRGVTEFLDEWWRLRGRPGAGAAVRILGRAADPRTHEMADLLHRHDLAYVVEEADEPLPVVVLRDGRRLVAPTNVEVADALGARTSPLPGVYDVVIIGGGPAGLAAAVYASSEGLRTGLIERSSMGGQAGTSSMIRNYLGFPRGISGAELATRSFDQAIQFGTEMVYGGEVVGLRVEGDLRIVELADGRSVPARAVIVATGVTYRQLDVPSLLPFAGTGVFYGSAMSEAKNLAGRPVVVVGGGNSAGQAALHLAKFASKVTVLVRSSTLAASMSEYLIRELGHTPNVEIRYGAEVVGGSGDGRLERLVVRSVGGGGGGAGAGAEESVEAAAVFVLIGASPHTSWMPGEIARDEWGSVLTAPGGFATSLPGVFAVGDVRQGSIKRVASAAGEGAVSVHLVHQYLRDLEQAVTTDVPPPVGAIASGAPVTFP
jgi:thioredoxin reductase (NADPH)